MSTERRWALSKCEHCGHEYARHDWKPTTHFLGGNKDGWVHGNSYCPECLQAGDLSQRERALVAARKRWLKIVIADQKRVASLRKKVEEKP